MSGTMKIYNSTKNSISIEGNLKESVKVFIPYSGVVEVSVRQMQFDTLWVETLANYMERGIVTVTLDGITLEPNDIRELKNTDINEVLGQWLESKERGAVPPHLGHGRFYSGADNHPHYRAGNGADFDLTAGGTYLEQVTHRIYVDGGRTDVYVEVGSVSRPFKMIQAAVNASHPGDCIDIAAGTYRENVTMIGNRHIDADPGTILEPVAGDALTITDSLVETPFFMGISFIRGLNISAVTMGAWLCKVVGSAAPPGWQPFVVWVDQVFNCINKSNGFSVSNGGMYFTDAGGVTNDGDSPVTCCRCDNGQIATGSFNFGVGKDGVLVDLHDNAMFLSRHGSFSPSGPNAVLLRMQPGPMAGASASFQYCQIDSGGGPSSWKRLMEGVSDNINVQFIGGSGTSQCTDDAFKFSGGYLELRDARWGSNGGRGIVAGQPGPGPNAQIQLSNAEISTQGNTTIDLKGGYSFNSQKSNLVNNGPAGGVVIANGTGPGSIVVLNAGQVQGPGPCLDLQAGIGFLTGGVDLVPTGGGIPGGIPFAVAMGANLFRGHANVRSGVPLVSGAETLLPSSFGTFQYGPSNALVKQGAGTVLPAGGQGYTHGSLFVFVPVPFGPPILYINTGTEAVPVWSVTQSFTDPAAPGTVWANPPGNPTDMQTAMLRVSSALSLHLGIPIP